MIVMSLLLFLVICGIIMKKYDSKYYVLFCLFCIGVTYALMKPDHAFDLYRHYEIFDYIDTLKLKDVFKSNNALNSTFSGLLFNSYVESSPGYLIIVYLLSRIGGHGLLIVFNTILVYGIPMFIVYDMGKRKHISNWYINISVMFLMLSINFLDVSGIRNILAAAIVALGLYFDLIRHKKRIICFVLYIFAILIHSSSAVIVLLRVLLIIKNKYLKRALVAITLFSVVALVLLYESGFQMGGGAIGQIINFSIAKLYHYVAGGGSSALIVSSSFYYANLLARILSYICVYVIASKTLFFKIKRDYESAYADFYALFLAFVLSSIIQYDLFVRLQFFAVILIAPVLPAYFQKVLGKRLLLIKQRTMVSTVFFYLGLAMQNALFFLISYRALDGFFL